MTPKEWLMRGRALEKTITALQEARKRAYAQATGATAPVRDTPGGKGSTENKADPYIELGEKIAEKESELAEIYGEIVRVLGEMRDNELQALLLERYVNGATWAQAARRLHYSEAHVKGYMHRMALNAVDKLIPHNTQ